jgi:hypothetical protein
MQSTFPGWIEKHKQHDVNGCDQNGNFCGDKFHVSPLLVID